MPAPPLAGVIQQDPKQRTGPIGHSKRKTVLIMLVINAKDAKKFLLRKATDEDVKAFSVEVKISVSV